MARLKRRWVCLQEVRGDSESGAQPRTSHWTSKKEKELTLNFRKIKQELGHCPSMGSVSKESSPSRWWESTSEMISASLQTLWGLLRRYRSDSTSWGHVGETTWRRSCWFPFTGPVGQWPSGWLSTLRLVACVFNPRPGHYKNGPTASLLDPQYTGLKSGGSDYLVRCGTAVAERTMVKSGRQIFASFGLWQSLGLLASKG